VHAFGGEVLKFIGDGVLAIFPVTGAPAEACEAALRAVVAARAGMAHLDAVRQAHRGALHRLHPAGCVSGSSPTIHRRLRSPWRTQRQTQSMSRSRTNLNLAGLMPTCGDGRP
jgi:class 3 adenylate cyclase